MENAELIKSARTIADSIHVHSSFQDWEAAEKDTLEKCAAALEAAEKRIAELETKEPTEKEVADYCKKRCLVIVTAELFHKMTSAFGRMQKDGERFENDPAMKDIKDGRGLKPIITDGENGLLHIE